MRPSSPPTPRHAAQAAQPALRLHVPDALADGATVTLSKEQVHYLLHVMRRAVGGFLRVFNGADGEHLATIVELQRDAGRLAIGPQLRAQQPDTDIWLAFALLKRNPTDLLVQKATELGAAALMPVFTTRTSADRTNADRLAAIAREAAEQSERLTLPVLHPPRALNAMLADWPPRRRLVACIERGGDHPMRPDPSGGPAGLLIGPEGGFTDPELDALRACPFVEPASLGPRILRAETAAIVGLALLQAPLSESSLKTVRSLPPLPGPARATGRRCASMRRRAVPASS